MNETEEHGPDAHEPGEPICKTSCPCCGSSLGITYGDDPGEISVIGDPEGTDLQAILGEYPTQLVARTKRAETVVREMLDDLRFIWGLMPKSWLATIPGRLHPTMYFTGSFEGDMATQDKVKDIAQRHGLELDKEKIDV
jgi:hypothetical protein